VNNPGLRGRGSQAYMLKPVKIGGKPAASDQAFPAVTSHGCRELLVYCGNPSLQTTARGQPPVGLGLRQTRSNGSRQAWGATN
jgi:hypothetical protein